MNRHLHDVFDRVADYDFSRQLKLHMIYYACNCINQACSQPKEVALADIRSILHTQQLTAAFQDFPLPNVPWKLKIQLLMMKYKLVRGLYLILSR